MAWSRVTFSGRAGGYVCPERSVPHNTIPPMRQSGREVCAGKKSSYFEAQALNYPLHLSFKILALARQLRLTDASGNRIFHVKQKVFKLKEAVTVFVDEGQTQPLYFMRADRVLDFSANYHFTDKAGAALGSVRRRGAKSLWRAQIRHP